MTKGKKLVSVDQKLLSMVKSMYEKQIEGITLYDTQIIDCALAQVLGKEIEIEKKCRKTIIKIS